MPNRDWKRPGSNRDKAYFEREPTKPPEEEESKYDCRLDTGRMKKVNCPECDATHDAWTGAGTDASDPVKPTPGSIIICSECASINRLTEDWTLEKADLDELAEMLSDAPEHARNLMMAMLQAGNKIAAKKNILALQEKCRQYYKGGDAEFVKQLTGGEVEIPKDSKVAVLDEMELRMVYKHMVATGTDQIGNLTKAAIEEMFERVGASLD